MFKTPTCLFAALLSTAFASGCRPGVNSTLVCSDCDAGYSLGDGCPAGETACTGDAGAVVCVNLQADGLNCGACGSVCDPGANCANAVCVCQTGQVDCEGASVCGTGNCGNGSACTNTQDDPANCSTCGNVCPAKDPYCTAGTCAASCTGAGELVCSINGTDRCVDTDTDDQNCGACGNACDPGASCKAGACTCQSGEVDCNGTTVCATGACGSGSSCSNTLYDPKNCAACGTACPAETPFCSGGVCTNNCTGAGVQLCTVNGADECRQTNTDNQNCGGCGNVCDPGATCANGTCTCPAHQVDCDGTTACAKGDCGGKSACTNPETDPNNCSVCGNQCGTSTPFCAAGTCSATCSGPGAQICPINGVDQCIDTNGDDQNCGACGNVCDPGSSCANGVCACGRGQVDCDGSTACTTGHCGGTSACKDLQADPENCDACGIECAATTPYCLGGACLATCTGAGVEICTVNGAQQCIRTSSDSANCGACGNICDPGASCAGGLCICARGELDCDGPSVCATGHCGDGSACTNTQADSSNCNTCGNQCAPATPYCAAGLCQATCAGANEAICPVAGINQCIDTQTDNQNCGACGNVCDPGASCVSGSCACPSLQVDCDGSGVCATGSCGGNSACTSLQTDPKNCRACGTQCGGETPYCTAGVCSDNCSGPGAQLCNVNGAIQCLDINTDGQNCGGCGNVCDPGASCANGFCACPHGEVDCDQSSVCPTGYCGGTSACTNTQNDANNCNACGNQCTAPALYCTGGACEATCTGAGAQVCTVDGTSQCINTNSDNQNCGGCGNVCDPGASCARGVCACATAQVDCNGASICTTGRCGGASACTSLQTDPANCQACGSQCSVNAPYCTAGICSGNCSGPGAQLCNINGALQCLDTNSDNQNCGGCGNICDPGATCASGACACPGSQVDCDNTSVCATGHCGGTSACTNTQTDANNCNTCGNQCSGTTPFCTDSACQASCAGTGETVCSVNGASQCVNTSTDGQNCGACGNVCDPGASCFGGLCTCPPGEVDCQGHGQCATGDCGGSSACTDLLADANNCNTCGTLCPFTAPFCTAGVCADNCSGPGSAVCPVAGALQCVDTDNDNENCGACGNVCGRNANTGLPLCQSGVCVSDCPTGENACPAARPTSCANFQTDPNNCGGCGVACGPNVACVAGVCGCDSTVTPNHCGTQPADYCTNFSYDPNNCGACGVACTGGVCSNGGCICPTAPDTTVCKAGSNYVCTNTQSDPTNCGGCGVTCKTGVSCTGGACLVAVVDLDFGYGTQATEPKIGKAATGSTATDYWNAAAVGFSSDWTLGPLHWVNGAVSPVSIEAINLPGNWGWPSGAPPANNDTMIESYTYSWSGSTAQVQIKSLPAGTYSIYSYCNVGTNNNTGFGVSVYTGAATGTPLYTMATKFTSSTTPNVAAWTEGDQYVVDRAVCVATGNTVVVNLQNGVQGTGNAGIIINGMQVVQTASGACTPPGP